jgi:hypothetical protein
MQNEVFIAIWAKGHDWMDASIKFLTHGSGTHAAFVRGNGRIAENFWPHVRERDWKAGERDTVEIYRIAGTTPDDWAAIENWIDGELKRPSRYSIEDLIRYALNLPPDPGSSSFCSMWILRCLRLNLAPDLQPLVRLSYPDYASPRDLRISPRLISADRKII